MKSLNILCVFSLFLGLPALGSTLDGENMKHELRPKHVKTFKPATYEELPFIAISAKNSFYQDENSKQNKQNKNDRHSIQAAAHRICQLFSYKKANQIQEGDVEYVENNSENKMLTFWELSEDFVLSKTKYETFDSGWGLYLPAKFKELTCIK